MWPWPDPIGPFISLFYLVWLVGFLAVPSTQASFPEGSGRLMLLCMTPSLVRVTFFSALLLKSAVPRVNTPGGT